MFLFLQVVHAVCRLMSECWNDKPAARLTMLRVRKTLDKLNKEISNEDKLLPFRPLSLTLSKETLSSLGNTPSSSDTATVEFEYRNLRIN